MSVGDAYSMGVKLTGDLTELRAELATGKQVVTEFSAAVTESMNRSAAAMERAAAAMEKSGTRTQKAVEKPKKPLVTAAQGFDDYMRRATSAQEKVASTTESASQRTSTSLGSVSSALTKLTGGIGFALLAKQVWDTGLSFATFTQNTQIAMSTLLGSDEAATSFLATIMDFAKTTPYAFTDLTTQAQKLISAGFDTEEIVPILTAVGDAATGMGKGVEGIDSITRALGQINTKGKLQSEELLQLSENGINGLKILANQAGVSTLEYQKLITAGLVPADEAINGLVEGIENGTDGVNGQTAAFTGLMAQIKGAGGITATVDSANTAFRNMSGALVDELTPAYLSLVRTATSGMGVIKTAANLFGDLPDPLQNAALAFTALTVANKLLNTQARATSAWSSFKSTMAASAATAEAMGQKVTGLRTALIAAKSVTGGIGSSLLSAFGGPVGLAITGVGVAVSAFASAHAAAQQEVEDLTATLDEQTGAITENTREFVVNKAEKEGLLKIADELGISTSQYVSALLGEPAAIEAVNAALDRHENALLNGKYAYDRTALSQDETYQQIGQLRNALNGQNSVVNDATEAWKRKQAAMEGDADAATATGDAYAYAASKVREFTEDEQKAITAAGDAALKAAQTNLGARSLNLATEDDVASARDKVTEATDKLSEAEADRDEKAASRKVSTSDKVKAENAVADARKALQDATEDLADTEDRADPVKQYKEQVQAIIDASTTFAQDIQTLADKGLNATDLSAIIAAGPEGSADTRQALLSDDSLIGFTNDARGLIDDAATTVENQAEIAQIALQDAGAGIWDNIGLGMRIAAEEGSADTVAALAAKLGENPQTVYDVGIQLGQSFLAGLSDATAYSGDALNAFAVSNMSGVKATGYATGGIFPGYTPGKDIGYIGVSGGEAIMRPEWTRAVGSGFVHHMNAIARTMGVGGVQSEMRRYLGGFASGGTVAPNVVTVPYTVTNERHDPMTFTGPIMLQSMDSMRPWADRKRALRNSAGRR